MTQRPNLKNMSGVCVVGAEVMSYNSRLAGEVAEWSKAHDWKSCIRQRIEGSNPSLSAKYL